MVDLYKSEAQAGASPFDNTGIRYSDVVSGHPGKPVGHQKGDELSVSPQQFGFPGENQVWAKGDSNQGSSKSPQSVLRIPRRREYITRNGHLVDEYLNGLKVDEYFGRGYHEKTVTHPNGSWTRLQQDWQHGKVWSEQHDDSGVLKTFETATSLDTSLRDPKGNLVFKMHQNKVNGDRTLIERGPDGKLVTKHFRLA